MPKHSDGKIKKGSTGLPEWMSGSREHLTFGRQRTREEDASTEDTVVVLELAHDEMKSPEDLRPAMDAYLEAAEAFSKASAAMRESLTVAPVMASFEKFTKESFGKTLRIEGLPMKWVSTKIPPKYLYVEGGPIEKTGSGRTPNKPRQRPTQTVRR